jgi:hypothetical protein
LAANYHNLSDIGLRALSGLTALTELDLYKCHNVSGNGVRAQLASLTTLTTLSLDMRIQYECKSHKELLNILAGEGRSEEGSDEEFEGTSDPSDESDIEGRLDYEGFLPDDDEYSDDEWSDTGGSGEGSRSDEAHDQAPDQVIDKGSNKIEGGGGGEGGSGRDGTTPTGSLFGHVIISRCAKCSLNDAP